jgi:hypothetical protein
MPDQPLLDRGGLVAGVVVQHQVQFQPFGDRAVDELEAAEEFLVAVPAVMLGDDRATGSTARTRACSGGDM